MRKAAPYLIFLAVLARTVAWVQDEPPIPELVWLLLAAFGLALAGEPWLSRRFPRFPFLYLVLQSALVVALLFAAPELDFLPSLFIPLSFQVVQFFGRRTGFIWIGAFTLAMAWPLLLGWEWRLAGLAMVLLYGCGNFLMGGYAHLVRQAEATRLENQRLIAELQAAFRQLQDYAMQVEEFSAAQERRYMARELHDSITQTLFSMNLAVQSARFLVEKDLHQVPEQLDRLHALSRSAADELRMLVDQLRPPSVDVEGLVAALRRLAGERQARDGLHICLEVSGEEGEQNLPEPVRLNLYRIAQEALNNVAKHAGRCEAFIRLNLDSRPAYLEVEDNGCGFDPSRAVRTLDHLGLSGMAERAREAGWRLDIRAQPGYGTRIRVEEVLNGEPAPA